MFETIAVFTTLPVRHSRVETKPESNRRIQTTVSPSQNLAAHG
jgi:hypothetical protein